MQFTLPKIYPITDTRLSGLSHAEQVKRLIAGGATFIQLREKYLQPRVFFEDAREALAVARDKGVKIIINDRVDIAVAIDADGVHLGQDDLPAAKARELLGNAAIIGLSTHDIEQASRALAEPVDYIAIGPIFDTTTKQNPEKMVGLDGLESVRQALDGFPLVAIGGITGLNVGSVLNAGADAAAMIGDLFADPAAIGQKYHRLANIALSVK